jgi:hypothetical protein
VRRALSPASGTRNKTSSTAEAFLDRTASLNGLSSRRGFLSDFFRRPVALILLGTVNHLISPQYISNFGAAPDVFGGTTADYADKTDVDAPCRGCNLLRESRCRSSCFIAFLINYSK